MNLDARLFLRINHWVQTRPALHPLFRFLATRCIVLYALSLTIASLLFRGWFLFLVLTTAFFFAWLVQFLLQKFIARPRPFLTLKTTPLIQLRLHTNAFPSGHATLAFSLALSAMYLFPSLALLWYSLAFGIALGRLLVGVHYPSDILGGAVLGSVCTELVFLSVFALVV